MKVYWNSLDARGQFVVAMKKFNLKRCRSGPASENGESMSDAFS